MFSLSIGTRSKFKYTMPRPKNHRIFALKQHEIIELLQADDSEEEGVGDIVDDEDVAFIQEDIEQGLEEAVILGPRAAIEEEMGPGPVIEEEMEIDEAEENIVFRWDKTPERIAIPEREGPIPDGRVTIDIDVFVDPIELDPLEVFEKVSKLDKLINLTIKESKRYMNQNGKVFDICAEEMKAFFGINLMMGYHRLPEIRNYWASGPDDDDLAVPLIANAMTRDRFWEIRSALHFQDNNKARKKQDPLYDRGYKITPLLEHFSDAFQSAMANTEHQSIDERIQKFKGQNSMKQFNDKKPIKRGFKYWCRCDSETGYLFEIKLYTGKKLSTEHGLGEGVIRMLSKNLHHQNVKLFFDNFFNSPNLMMYLEKKGIMACGTVIKNRKNMPKDFKSDKDMSRGDQDTKSFGNIRAIKWIDNKAVYLLTNYLNPTSTMFVKRRKKGSSTSANVKCPKAIKVYNTYMGGVDKLDQMQKTYELDVRSTKKYYLRSLFDLLSIGVINAGIVYQKLGCNINVPSTSRASQNLNFRRMIAKRLIRDWSRGQQGTRVRPVMVVNRGIGRGDAMETDHKPTREEKRRRCTKCYNDSKADTKTNMFCIKCGVYLCLNKERNCFGLYHSNMN